MKVSRMEEENLASSQGKGRRGYLNPQIVKGFAFFVITICIVISVVACLLAIWEFAKPDVLWRTVATCVVVAAGVAIFTVVNTAFGDKG